MRRSVTGGRGGGETALTAVEDRCKGDEWTRRDGGLRGLRRSPKRKLLCARSSHCRIGIVFACVFAASSTFSANEPFDKFSANYSEGLRIFH